MAVGQLEGSNVNLGVMQGRLSPMIGDRIQKFPWGYWQSEFALIKKLGINNLEWTIDSDQFEFNPILMDQGIEEIKNLQSEYSININSITCDYIMENPFWTSDRKIESLKIKNNFQLLIESANILKILYIVVPLVDKASIKTLEVEKKIIEYFSSMQEILFHKNVKIIFESDYKPSQLADFISKLNPEIFGINYDSGNSAALGYNVIEEFECYSKYIRNIHIKDRIFHGGTVDLGTGNVDFDLLFKCIKNCNYQENLILQSARPANGDNYSNVECHINFIKNYLKRYEIQFQ